MTKAPQDIPNFDEITSLYEQWLEDTSNDSMGLVVINTEGYDEWYEWMRENEPDKLL